MASEQPRPTILQPPKLRILVIENEYLIAMDAERILMDALDCSVVIATLHNFHTAMAEEIFDIVLLDFGETPGPTIGDLAVIVGSGAKLVFTTAADAFAAGVPGFDTSPVVMKPYNEGQLSDAVKRTLGVCA